MTHKPDESALPLKSAQSMSDAAPVPEQLLNMPPPAPDPLWDAVKAALLEKESLGLSHREQQEILDDLHQGLCAEWATIAVLTKRDRISLDELVGHVVELAVACRHAGHDESSDASVETREAAKVRGAARVMAAFLSDHGPSLAADWDEEVARLQATAAQRGRVLAVATGVHVNDVLMRNTDALIRDPTSPTDSLVEARAVAALLTMVRTGSSTNHPRQADVFDDDSSKIHMPSLPTHVAQAIDGSTLIQAAELAIQRATTWAPIAQRRAGRPTLLRSVERRSVERLLLFLSNHTGKVRWGYAALLLSIASPSPTVKNWRPNAARKATKRALGELITERNAYLREMRDRLRDVW